MPLPSASRSRILLATANRNLALQLAGIVGGLQYAVQLAENGPNALKLLLDVDPPEIALLDAALPVQSGLDLAAELRRRGGQKRTWIMLLCGAADAATIAAAADAGVDDLFLCPASVTDTEPLNEADLRIRLSVASRVQEMGHQLEAQIQGAGFHATCDHLTGLLGIASRSSAFSSQKRIAYSAWARLSVSFCSISITLRV